MSGHCECRYPQRWQCYSTGETFCSGCDLIITDNHQHESSQP